MKNLIIIFGIILFNTLAYSQTQNIQAIFNDYIHIKNDLVKSDDKLASQHAKDMLSSIEKAASFTEKSSLIKSVTKLINSKGIEKQRDAFADLSILMWQIIKKTDGLDQTIYYQYCSMKKMYWLSTEKDIKNPYYGSKMLTCGSIVETKNK